MSLALMPGSVGSVYPTNGLREQTREASLKTKVLGRSSIDGGVGKFWLSWPHWLTRRHQHCHA